MQLIMNKILVPVDFSGSSDWGFYYAYNLAQQFGAELYVLHIYRPPYVESTMPPDMIKQILHDREMELLGHLKANAQPPLIYPKDKVVDRVVIHYLLESGADVDIAAAAEKIDADLVVMGTHGAGNAMDKVWGTNTAKVIRTAKCPVMAIPSGVSFEGVRSIAYATDYDVDDLDNILQLVLFATAINAKVHCIHINHVLSEANVEIEADFKNKFQERFKELPVTFSVRSSTSIEEGLETFLRINKVDILSMLTHKRSLWDRLFGEKSMTREMAMRSNIPLLAFHS